MRAAVASEKIAFLLNGRPVCAEGVSPQTTLLDFLRGLGLTGAKEGCAEGECGACAVVLVAEDGAGSCYRAVNSCLMLVPMAAGQEIYTIESLAQNSELAPVQQALAEAGGSQCGYCTPGFVMSLFAEQYRPGRTSACDPHQLGNLCRCTGYRPIRDAARSLGPPPQGPFLDRLAKRAPKRESLHFEEGGRRFSTPTTIDECVALLADDPEAYLIAGGTDLAVESNLKYRRWRHLVSLEAIPALREFTSNGSVEIGAALPLTEIAARWTDAPPSLREWSSRFASTLIRNRATLGGNLATASPIGDGGPLLLALGAVVRIAGPQGMRNVPLDTFFTGYRRTVLGPGEVIVAIEIPKPLPALSRFYKVAKRRMDDISTVAAGFGMDWDASGRISRVRFAFGGVAAIPIRAVEAENAIIGRRWNEDAVERVTEILDRTLQPINDHRGSAEYRLEIAKSLVEKFWAEWREEH